MKGIHARDKHKKTIIFLDTNSRYIPNYNSLSQTRVIAASANHKKKSIPLPSCFHIPSFFVSLQ
jgi:hypothetical protein